MYSGRGSAISEDRCGQAEQIPIGHRGFWWPRILTGKPVERAVRWGPLAAAQRIRSDMSLLSTDRLASVRVGRAPEGAGVEAALLDAQFGADHDSIQLLSHHHFTG
jgi:hypothetical protein